jgi:hypothetical protein
MEELILPGVINHSELKDKPITLFNDIAITDRSILAKNPYNFLFILEPNEFFGYHDFARQHAHLFSAIFTWSKSILDNVPNAYPFYFGAGNMDLVPRLELHTDKLYEMSFLCGNKQVLEGHHLRHRIYSSKSRFDIPTHFIYTAPWENGKDRCWNSMFHVAVENSKHHNYFTEKIVEAFITKTIPLYWGCPNIGDFFNLDGIVIFENEADLIEKSKMLTPEFYKEREEVILENREKAFKYNDIITRMRELLIEVCKINGI